MNVIFGAGPLAQALATDLATRGSTVLVGPHPVEGPFLWRYADTATGRGVRWAAEGGHRVYVVLDTPLATQGLFLILRHAHGLHGAVVVPLGQEEPRGMAQCPGLSRVHVGPVWGPDEPLVAAWASAIAQGRRVWVPNPGVVRPVAMSDAVAAIEAAGGQAGVRWVLGGQRDVRLADLAEALGRGLGRPVRRLPAPLQVAAWRAGIDAEAIQDWVKMPVAPWRTGDWELPRPAGEKGWLGDPARWR